MQTYVFTVAVSGDDVQDVSEALREKVIDLIAEDRAPGQVLPPFPDVHVTEAVRVTG